MNKSKKKKKRNKVEEEIRDFGLWWREKEDLLFSQAIRNRERDCSEYDERERERGVGDCGIITKITSY